MHALGNLHHALVPDGLIVDTQPISAQPRVLADNVELGTLDMREWAEQQVRLRLLRRISHCT